MAPHNTSSTEQNFRNNLSQFAWARGSTNDLQPSQQQQSQPRQSGNPFARFYNAVAGDYIPLRSNERSNEDEAWLALSRWERCRSICALCLELFPMITQGYWDSERVFLGLLYVFSSRLSPCYGKEMQF